LLDYAANIIITVYFFYFLAFLLENIFHYCEQELLVSACVRERAARARRAFPRGPLPGTTQQQVLFLFSVSFSFLFLKFRN
jgi:hypothetical protein